MQHGDGLSVAGNMDECSAIALLCYNVNIFMQNHVFGGENQLYTGIIFGIYVLFTIGLYHILVVKLEERFGVWPWLVFLLLGLLSLYFSWIAASGVLSMWWGYNAFLNLWAIKEMFEQPARRLAKQ